MMNWVYGVFEVILRRSAAVLYIIPMVLVVRLLMKRFPKKYSYWLWAVVGLRLLIDTPICSVLSLFNYVSYGAIFAGGSSEEIPGMGQPDGVIGGTMAQNTGQSTVGQTISQGEASPANSLFHMAAFLWILGIGVIAVMTIVSYVKMRRRVATATRDIGNIYECDYLSTPFVMGLLRPRIYLPYHMEETERSYIIRHEQYHIRRRDPIVKVLAFLLRTLYWFHPMVWISYALMVRDMEMSCDEAVLLQCGSQIKQEYSRSLLQFAAKKPYHGISPIAFGESHAGGRIQNVLRFHKPKVWIGVAGMLVLGMTAAMCLTSASPKEKDPIITLLEKMNYSELVFDGSPLVIQLDGQLIMIDDNYFIKVLSPEFTSVADIRAVMQEVYTDRFIQERRILEGEYAIYIDHEGELYRMAADCPYVPWGPDYEKLEEQEDRMVLRVLDGGGDAAWYDEDGSRVFINHGNKEDLDFTYGEYYTIMTLVRQGGKWKVDDMESKVAE